MASFWLTGILLAMFGIVIYAVHRFALHIGKTEARKESAEDVLRKAVEANEIERKVDAMPIDAARAELLKDATE